MTPQELIEKTIGMHEMNLANENEYKLALMLKVAVDALEDGKYVFDSQDGSVSIFYRDSGFCEAVLKKINEIAEGK
jgi:hypothetical protein